jgi:hypothetical protein
MDQAEARGQRHHARLGGRTHRRAALTSRHLLILRHHELRVAQDLQASVLRHPLLPRRRLLKNLAQVLEDCLGLRQRGRREALVRLPARASDRRLGTEGYG